MDFDEVVKQRRSIRKFKDKEVSDEQIDALIESARLAPTGANRQNFLLGIVKDKQMINDLAEAAGNQMWIATAPVVIALCATLRKDLSQFDEDDPVFKVDRLRFKDEVLQYLKQFGDQRAVSILFEDATPLIPGEHIHLCATDLGLSACWIGFLDVEKASEILNLPDDLACIYLMPVGYADQEPRDIRKKSREEITFFDRYSK
jgi:nitroreductase